MEKETTEEILDEEVVSEESLKKTEDVLKKADETLKKAEDAKTTKEDKTPKEKKGIFKKKEDEALKRLQEENALLKDKYLRVNAEMQNMRRRMEEEKANLLKYEGENIIKSILPIVDNFERAINMDDANLEDEVSKFLTGFKMIYGNLNTTLQGFEVKAIDALNQPFDPNTMEAVMAEHFDGIEPNMVVDVMQKGYTYRGKVIRHAMVKVSK